MPIRQTLFRVGPSAKAQNEKIVGAMARSHTRGMLELVHGAQDEMRDDVLAAGLGRKLAGAVRSKVYPAGNRESLAPAGIIFANPGKPGGRSAASILGHYERGDPITPVLGDTLAIPTPNVPRAGRGGRRRMTVAEVEAFYNTKLVRVRLKSGKIGLFMRKKVAGKFKSVLMFTIVKDVAGNKKLDFAGIVRRWGARFGELAAANFTLGRR